MFSICPASLPTVAAAKPMRTANMLSPMLLDPLHLADDVAQHSRIFDRVQRHLDALLDRDGLGARLDRVRRRLRSDR